MTDEENYNIDTTIAYGPLEHIDTGKIADDCEKDWFNTSLCRVNDCVVRLGVVKGEFHWHSHEAEDEFFYCVEGKLLVDLEDRTVELAPREGFVVPKGVRHKTRAPERTVMLMFEGSGVAPTGD